MHLITITVTIGMLILIGIFIAHITILFGEQIHIMVLTPLIPMVITMVTMTDFMITIITMGTIMVTGEILLIDMKKHKVENKDNLQEEIQWVLPLQVVKPIIAEGQALQQTLLLQTQEPPTIQVHKELPFKITGEQIQQVAEILL